MGTGAETIWLPPEMWSAAGAYHAGHVDHERCSACAHCVSYGLIPAGAPTLRCRVGTRPLAHRGRPVCSLWAWPAQRKRGISMQLSSTSRGAQRVVLCLPPPGRLTVSPKSPRCPGGLSHGRRDLNPQPSVLETDALPFELHPLGCSGHEERATCRMAGDPFSGVSYPHIEITIARLRH